MIGTVFLNMAKNYSTLHYSAVRFQLFLRRHFISYLHFLSLAITLHSLLQSHRLILFSSHFFAHLIGAEGLVKLAAGKYVRNCLSFKLPVILYVLCCTSLISTLK